MWDERVRGHIFVAALEALRTVHVVGMKVGSEHRKGITGGHHRARQVLQALGISALESPEKEENSTVKLEQDSPSLMRMMELFATPSSSSVTVFLTSSRSIAPQQTICPADSVLLRNGNPHNLK
jgi:hypothetical protein